MNILDDQEKDVESCRVCEIKSKGIKILIEEYVSFVNPKQKTRFVGIYQNQCWNWKSFHSDQDFLQYFLELKAITRE